MPAHPGEVRPVSPELEQCLRAYDSSVHALALQLRALVLSEAPEAAELLYDGYNAVALAFSFTGRLAFCHLAVYARHVNLGFNRGSELPDPDGLLQGSGKLIRHLKVRTPEDLEQPHLRDFVRLAVARAQGARGVLPGVRSLVQVASARKRRPG